MTTLPDDIIAHCKRYRLCKGCPLIGTCIAPLSNDSEKWAAWIDDRIAAVRALGESQ